MKKHLIIISLIVIVVSIFVLYFANSSSEDISNTDISTTSVTDSDGTTHYYEPVTDNKDSVSMTAENKGVFSEIETTETAKETKPTATSITAENTTNKNETTTQKSTQPATDKDGWITKWY